MEAEGSSVVTHPPKYTASYDLTWPVTAMITPVFLLPYLPVSSLMWPIIKSIPTKKLRVYFVVHPN